VPRLSELLVTFEEAWPESHADDWDRVGLSVGSKSAEISCVLVSVDLTHEVIDEAIELGAQVILTHHPLLLKGVDSVSEDKLKGSLISRLIRHSIATYSAHTNADVQVDGASSAMAKAFGLEKLRPLVTTEGGFGHGVIGTLPQPVALAEFAAVVSGALPKTARKVAYSGEPEALITSVAICSGAGDSFIPVALNSDADVYVTSDLRHHPALDAVSTPRAGRPLALIDVSHWAAESLWVGSALEKLSELPNIRVIASNVKTDPWTQEVN
jgi:dinuclear metal center YbgI/SA1388 family protein